jgi:hypothetical protein
MTTEELISAIDASFNLTYANKLNGSSTRRGRRRRRSKSKSQALVNSTSDVTANSSSRAGSVNLTAESITRNNTSRAKPAKKKQAHPIAGNSTNSANPTRSKRNQKKGTGTITASNSTAAAIQSNAKISISSIVNGTSPKNSHKKPAKAHKQVNSTSLSASKVDTNATTAVIKAPKVSRKKKKSKSAETILANLTSSSTSVEVKDVLLDLLLNMKEIVKQQKRTNTQLMQLIQYNQNRDLELEHMSAISLMNELESAGYEVHKLPDKFIYHPDDSTLLEWDGILAAEHHALNRRIIFVIETKQIFTIEKWNKFDERIKVMAAFMQAISANTTFLPNIQVLSQAGANETVSDEQTTVGVKYQLMMESMSRYHNYTLRGIVASPNIESKLLAVLKQKQQPYITFTSDQYRSFGLHAS